VKNVIVDEYEWWSVFLTLLALRNARLAHVVGWLV